MGVVETVKVVSSTAKDGYVVINKSDLGHRDKIFEAKAVEKEVPEEVVEEVKEVKAAVTTNFKQKKEGK